MFALMGLENDPLRINLKYEPEKALELREQYLQVLPGWHMNKKHWNTVVAGDLPLQQIYEWIEHSYQLAWNSLPKKIRDING